MEQLQTFTVGPEKFPLKALPGYALFLLENYLDAYVEAMIENSEREELPLLKKLVRFSRPQLVELGRISHGDILRALATNAIHLQIEGNLKKWIGNNLEVIDKDEVVAEDVTLSAFIKRKCLQSFIPYYTKDEALVQNLREEIDLYTTREELISYSIYLKLQQDKLNKANAALRFQEDLLLEAQQLSDLGSFFIDYQNPANSTSTPQVAVITGISGPDDTSFFSRVHDDDRDRIQTQWENAINAGGAFDYTFRYHHNDTEKRLHSRGIVTRRNGAVSHVTGTIRDITQVAQLIDRLTETESLNKEAQRLTHLGNWSWDIGNDAIQWSDEMYRIYGLEPQSEDITFERFIGLIHPDSRETRISEINESLATGVAKDYMLKIVTPAGEVKMLRGFGSITHDSTGKPVKLVGTCQDITREHHLKSELIKLNEELSVKNEKLSRTNKELESFNYIASHDLQEPLRKIELYTEKIIYQSGALPDGVNVTLQKVINAASRMRTLINDLMAFSQISLVIPTFEKVSLQALTDEVLDFFSDAVEKGEVKFEIDPLPLAAVSPVQFQQLLTNLFSNSIKYRKSGQAVEIQVTNALVDADQMEFADAKGTYLKIAVTDNGIGFDAAQGHHIFDLFKRLHSNETYSGTGIGLAICKKIVQNHNGFITAGGSPGVGAHFTIYLPHA